MVVLYKQLVVAFFANPGLNALIGAVLLIGTILSFRQVIRLYPEVAWVNNFRISDPGLAVARHPKLLAPMAAILGGERTGRMTISQQTMRHLLDSIATRLDEARDISRYMTGLLVFLGLLGTFWGLIETVGSVGKVIDGLKVGGDAGALFDTLKEGLAAPLGGMGISFSSSLFGLAGSKSSLCTRLSGSILWSQRHLANCVNRGITSQDEGEPSCMGEGNLALHDLTFQLTPVALP